MKGGCAGQLWLQLPAGMAVETYLPQPPPPPVGPQVHQGVQGSALQTAANKQGCKEQHQHGKQTERCVM